MIEIKHYDSQENLAESILAVMQSVYEQSPWTLEQIGSSMASQDEDYYLAYEGQELVGFLAVQTVLDEMEILQIAVRADFQRLGIASQLMAAVMDWEGDIFLEVRESNRAAQALYARQHFTKIGKRKDYYRHPVEDAVMMKRERDER
ncbi:TPA: ribosomal protein S18-alanine N-acetyltransferase [Streptococcus suis]|uniref:ribosomal protein S18-alanine N-acetyltransferase n=1 Tax=Streptococcus parasuis TaxID=1501662 RepID=UPI002379CF7A|nr:ribosomal protein S18-alanine N-acetyltransferase [Streptococcus parasuis]HEM3617149.1 ribosomal protein S18-alanine N-acetyltransferase [Streptococcus suis]WDN58384.1 ribosomal protein S18-alanine N-acetyltransferase [Streptococcus parasuis]WDN60200.1 ribosomal protein S18-alanine N-acetyltransferase [Streptococcus parasuis]HEM3650964.1 ribosomal protein S18-alanine N-acetyltransferase [Streptococcus suis]HEM3659327.1 ribosomal protein S18-alanine N-acetyltransferase [Streptococcus suis]